MKELTIIGGGSSTHTLIPMLSKTPYKINLLTSKPDLWNKVVSSKYVLPDGTVDSMKSGELHKISDKPELVIPGAAIIILCMPVHQYRNALKRIAPYISKDSIIGTIYGQAGFNWMVEEIIKAYRLENISYFAFGLIPWICRIEEYGKVGVTYGSKEKNCVAVYPKAAYEELHKELFSAMSYDWFDTGEFVLADNFLSLTLSVDNQMIHPTRLYSIDKETTSSWLTVEDVPFFYKDYTSFSGEVLRDIDLDYSKIRARIKSDYPEKSFNFMFDYLEYVNFSYNSHCVDIVQSLKESKNLGHIKTPTVFEDGFWTININHRFFYDDIFYGICIAKWFADKLAIDVPCIDTILRWAQDKLNRKIINESNDLILADELGEPSCGIPSVYGYNNIRELLD